MSKKKSKSQNSPLTSRERITFLKILLYVMISLALLCAVFGIAACFYQPVAGMFLVGSAICILCLALWCVCQPDESLAGIVRTFVSPFQTKKT